MHIRLKTLLLLVSPLLLLVVAAYVQWGTVGLPALPANPVFPSETAVKPYGFPAWLRMTHYVNFLFLILLVRSGLQILADHPRLYWNVHCTPGTSGSHQSRCQPRLDGQGRLPDPVSLLCDDLADF